MSGDDHFGAPSISTAPEPELPEFNAEKEAWWRARRQQDEPWEGYGPEPAGAAGPVGTGAGAELARPTSLGLWDSFSAALRRAAGRLLAVTAPVSWLEGRERAARDEGGAGAEAGRGARGLGAGAVGLLASLWSRLRGDAGGHLGRLEPVASLIARSQRLDREGLAAIAELDVRRAELSEDDAFWLVQRLYHAVSSELERGDVLCAYKLVEGVERPCHELRLRGFGGCLDAASARLEGAWARARRGRARPSTPTTEAVRRLVEGSETVEALSRALEDLPAVEPTLNPTATSRDFHLNELALREGFPELYRMLPERARGLVDRRLAKRERSIERERALEWRRGGW